MVRLSPTEAYIEAVLELAEANERTGLFGEATPIAVLEEKVERARIAAKESDR